MCCTDLLSVANSSSANTSSANSSSANSSSANSSSANTSYQFSFSAVGVLKSNNIRKLL